MHQELYTVTLHRSGKHTPRRLKKRRKGTPAADKLYWAASLAVILMACGFILAGALQSRSAAPAARDGKAVYVLTIGTVLETPRATEEPAPAEYAAGISPEDAELLARLVWLEARGEPAEGQQAVAEVVLNRVAADNFPNTIREVIYEGYGTDHQQFAPAGLIDTVEPTETQRAAVELAATGERILPADVVYFSTEPENGRVWGKIGNHVFCHQYIWE